MTVTSLIKEDMHLEIERLSIHLSATMWQQKVVTLHCVV